MKFDEINYSGGRNLFSWENRLNKRNEVDRGRLQPVTARDRLEKRGDNSLENARARRTAVGIGGEFCGRSVPY